MQNENPEDRKRRHAAHVECLIREGRMTRHGTGSIPKELFEMRGPEDPEGLLLKALLDDRRNGR